MALLVKGTMQRCIAPEMMAMEAAYADILEHWRVRGADVIIGADGTSVCRFCGFAIKLEIGTAKIIAPLKMGATGSQQAPFLGIPLLMHDVEECTSP